MKAIFKVRRWKGLINGIMLFPFIILNARSWKYRHYKGWLVQHELIHFEQAKETLVLGFYLIYGCEYIWNRLKGLKGQDAYLNISFEIEAYKNENKPKYLSERKRYAWLKR